MTKIMLVEDDNNLREIYEARLLAEGYEIVSAQDGEEALAIAVKEKPDLIISDVMMPKISGFDMLDILRSTPETKDTKVIMMTALSQAEDKQRADRLGADRYLVKSQVTLEDVAKVAREVIDNVPAGTQPPTPDAATPEVVPPQPTAPPAADPVPSAAPAPVATPAAPTDLAQATTPTADPAPAPSTPISVTVADDTSTPNPTPAPTAGADQQIAQFQSSQAPAVSPTPIAITDQPASPEPAPSPDPTPASATTAPAPQPATSQSDGTMQTPRAETMGSKKVLAPIHDISAAPVDLNALLAKEESGNPPAASTIINPTEPPTT